MKSIIITGLLLCSLYSAHAQVAATGNKATEGEQNSSIIAENDFSQTSIKLRNQKIVFCSLPQMTKSAALTITNSQGETVQQVKINPVDNTVDIRYLDKGTYYLHLRYKGQEKKGFVLNL